MEELKTWLGLQEYVRIHGNPTLYEWMVEVSRTCILAMLLQYEMDNDNE